MYPWLTHVYKDEMNVNEFYAMKREFMGLNVFNLGLMRYIRIEDSMMNHYYDFFVMEAYDMIMILNFLRFNIE